MRFTSMASMTSMQSAVRKSKDRKPGQRGLSAVELAFILPIVLVILFGIAEFGLAFWRKQILTGAVREGARAGIVDSTSCAEIKDAVEQYLTSAGLDAGKVSITPTGCPATSGDPVTVSATYPSSFTVLSKMKFSKTTTDQGNDILLNASVTMQAE